MNAAGMGVCAVAPALLSATTTTHTTRYAALLPFVTGITQNFIDELVEELAKEDGEDAKEEEEEEKEEEDEEGACTAASQNGLPRSSKL